ERSTSWHSWDSHVAGRSATSTPSDRSSQIYSRFVLGSFGGCAWRSPVEPPFRIHCIPSSGDCTEIATRDRDAYAIVELTLAFLSFRRTRLARTVLRLISDLCNH